MRPLLAGLVCACALAAAQEGSSPARYRSGAVPVLPVLAVGGGEVLLEATVAEDGHVADVKPLRATDTFTEPLVAAVGGWKFVPAEERVADPRPGEPRSRPVGSTVLIAGVFRPPTVNTPTLGELPRDVASPARATPFPLTTIIPPFPPLARNSGVVLVEATVDDSGTVVDVRTIKSAPPFDQAAEDALRQWMFRPARLRGVPVPALVYVVFGFPMPVTLTPGSGVREQRFEGLVAMQPRDRVRNEHCQIGDLEIVR